MQHFVAFKQAINGEVRCFLAEQTRKQADSHS